MRQSGSCQTTPRLPLSHVQHLDEGESGGRSQESRGMSQADWWNANRHKAMSSLIG